MPRSAKALVVPSSNAPPIPPHLYPNPFSKMTPDCSVLGSTPYFMISIHPHPHSHPYSHPHSSPSPSPSPSHHPHSHSHPNPFCQMTPDCSVLGSTPYFIMISTTSNQSVPFLFDSPFNFGT